MFKKTLRDEPSMWSLVDYSVLDIVNELTDCSSDERDNVEAAESPKKRQRVEQVQLVPALIENKIDLMLQTIDKNMVAVHPYGAMKVKDDRSAWSCSICQPGK